MGVLSNIHLLLKLVDALLLMEIIQFLVKFAHKNDNFICDFLAMSKVCQNQLYTLFCNTPSSSKLMNIGPFMLMLQGDQCNILFI